MASTGRSCILQYLFWQSVLFLLLHLVNVNAQSCVITEEQPVVSSLDPPSGTTGTDESVSTLYTITGERLDHVSNISVEVPEIELASIIIDSEESTITLRLSFARFGTGRLATVTIVPNNTACSDIIITISLHDTSKL